MKKDKPTKEEKFSDFQPSDVKNGSIAGKIELQLQVNYIEEEKEKIHDEDGNPFNPNVVWLSWN